MGQLCGKLQGFIREAQSFFSESECCIPRSSRFVARILSLYIHKSLKGSRSFAYESSRALFKSSRGSLGSSGALFSVGCGTVVEVVSQTSVILNTRTTVDLNNRTGLEVTLSDVTTVDSFCYQVLPISFTPDLCITLWATSLWRSPCWAPNHVTGSDVTQLVMMLSSIFLAVVIESKWHNRLWSYIASFQTCCRRDCCQKTCTICN